MKQEVKEALLKAIEDLAKDDTFNVSADYEWGNINAMQTLYGTICISVYIKKSTDPRKDKK